MKKIVSIFVMLLFVVMGTSLEGASKKKRIKYVNEHPEIETHIKETIIKGKVCLGMTREHVFISWGNPLRINKSIGSWGRHEQWVCGHPDFPSNWKYLYFENNILTSMQL